jgi:hypothetical protein
MPAHGQDRPCRPTLREVPNGGEILFGVVWLRNEEAEVPHAFKLDLKAHHSRALSVA